MIAGLAFLAVSALTARWLGADVAERDRVEEVLRAQVSGDADALVAALDGCAAAPVCVERQRRNARRLRSPGELQIVAYDSATARSTGAATGPTRVVWKTPQRLTVVQCARVERTGGLLRGVEVRVPTLSAPIPRTASC